jgi:hypothetical protein
MVSRLDRTAWKVHRSIPGRIVEALIVLITALTLGSHWYLPHWAARMCARSSQDPVAVLAKVPLWLRLLLDDCDTADAIVLACWGP